MLSGKDQIIFLTGFIFYIVLLIFLGWLLSRKKTEGGDFITGGRDIPTFLIFSTICATLIGTGSSIGATSNGFVSGWGGAVFGLASCLGMFCVGKIFSFTRKYNFLTMSEEAQFYFNGNKNVRKFSSIVMFIIEVVWLGNHINGGGKYLSFVTGISPTLAKFIVMMGFAIFCFIGGYMAVVWTDTIQFIIIITGFIAIMFTALHDAGGMSGITTAYIDAGKQDALSLFGYKALGIMPMLALFFSQFISILGTPTFRTRIYTAKDTKTAKKSFRLSSAVALCYAFIPAIIGMCAFTLAYRSNNTDIMANPDFAFSYLAIEVLPSVLGLIFLIAGLSATMSSGSSDAMSAVTILVTDIYEEIGKKKVDGAQYKRISRIGLIVSLVLAYLSTMLASDIMAYITNVIGALVPSMAVMLVFGRYWKRATWQGALASMLGGTVFGMLYLFVLPLQKFVYGIFAGPALPVTIVASVFMVIVSLCTHNEKKTEEEKMEIILSTREGI